MEMAHSRILVAPLDWGLGHATRCIPLIDRLLKSGQEVLLGGSGNALTLLTQTFPALAVLELPAYRVRYGAGRQQIPVLLKQTPRILSVVREEHRILQSALGTHRIGAVISDNRYGLWSNKVPTAIICHQLSIALPASMSLFHHPLYLLHRRFLRRFGRCWVPDFPAPGDLSGDLAHAYPAGDEVCFLGPLSRFAHRGPVPEAFSYPQLGDALPDVAAVLSGPEPQRSMLEALLREQAADYEGKLWIVQGLTRERKVEVAGHITHISYMDTADLHRLYSLAPGVISRPGYSSLMDFQALGLRRIVLVPTPGQTEQEYLGDALSRKGIAAVFPQHAFQLREAIRTLGHYRGFEAEGSESSGLLQKALDALLSQMDR
jgi:hypothetical protein